MFPTDVEGRRLLANERSVELQAAFAAGASQEDCGSPSQHPSLNRHLAHCQVPWRHSMAAPQRKHFSATATSEP
jgi:hypothetical protein